MTRRYTPDQVELAAMLRPLLQTESASVTIPRLDRYTPEELRGFIEGVRCARCLLERLPDPTEQDSETLDSWLMLVEVAARGQLRRRHLDLPCLRLVADDEESETRERDAGEIRLYADHNEPAPA